MDQTTPTLPPTHPGTPEPGEAVSALRPERDPVTKLRPMSRTAGLGSGEYAAINTPSVVALVLGLASGLMFFGPALVTVPILALIFAAVGFRQVRRSNGTQTGLLLAIGGAGLAVGFVAWAVIDATAERTLRRTDGQAVRTLVDRFGEALVADDFVAAYALFDTRFQELVPVEQFEQTMRGVQQGAFYGQIIGVDAGSILRFETTPGTDVRTGSGMLLVRIQRPPLPTDTPQTPGTPPEAQRLIDEQPATFRRVGGEWRILTIPNWFGRIRQPGQPTGEGSP